MTPPPATRAPPHRGLRDGRKLKSDRRASRREPRRRRGVDQRRQRLAHAARDRRRATALGRGQQVAARPGAGRSAPASGSRSRASARSPPGDLGLPHRDQVLDADAVGAGLVVAGLVGDDHAGLQGRRCSAPWRCAAAPRARRGRSRRRGRCRGRSRGRPATARARQRVELRAGGAGREAHRASAMWPFSTRVKRSRISAVGVADRDGAGDVGGAVEVLARRNRPDRGCPARACAWSPRAAPVVHDGAVGAGAGDGVEAQVLQRAGLLAEAPPAGPTASISRELAALAPRWPASGGSGVSAAPSRRARCGCPRSRRRSCRPWAARRGRRRAPPRAGAPAGGSTTQTGAVAGSTSTRLRPCRARRARRRARPVGGTRHVVAEPGRVRSGTLRRSMNRSTCRRRAGSRSPAAAACAARRRRGC